jgi:hypothetical protein
LQKPLLAAPLCLALAAAVGVGCTGVSSTSVAPAKPGIRVRAESITQGRGCGKGAGQIYKYSAFLRYLGPADADGTVWTDFSSRTAEQNQRVDVDCFADADFTDLLERQSFSVDVCATTWDEWARAHGLDPARKDAGPDTGADAAPSADAEADASGDAEADAAVSDAAVSDAEAEGGSPEACGSASLTTVCTATTEPNVFPIVAACAKLVGPGDAGAEGGTTDAATDATPADGAVDAPAD